MVMLMEAGMVRIVTCTLLALVAVSAAACTREGTTTRAVPDPAVDLDGTVQRNNIAVLAGGCFWCMEAVFEQLRGVSEVVSGYAGGSDTNANYGAIASGATHHAEAIRITYDPQMITYGQLLKVFFTVAHDPTQKDRQGPDTGPQYRSAIFTDDNEQRRVAEASIRQLEDGGVWPRPVVTIVEPLGRFYPAETYHQDYVKRNPRHPYVVVNALPKVAKLTREFPDLAE